MIFERYVILLKGGLLDLGCGEKTYKLIYKVFCESSIGIDVETCKHEQKYVDIFASTDNMLFEDAFFDSIICTNIEGMDYKVLRTLDLVKYIIKVIITDKINELNESKESMDTYMEKQ